MNPIIAVVLMAVCGICSIVFVLAHLSRVRSDEVTHRFSNLLKKDRE